MSTTIKSKVRGVTADDEISEHSRQEIIKRLVHEGDILTLERDPSNSKDKNAIMVSASPDNDPWGEGDYTIGYLSSELAAKLAPVMDAGGLITCEVLSKTRGSDEETGTDVYGVNISLEVAPADEMNQSRPPVAAAPPAINLIQNFAPQGPQTNNSRYVTNSSDKSKKTALILCIFLGLFGVHQFYVGKIGTGLLYLFTAGLFGIGWIADIFKIMLGSFRDNVGNPLRQ